MSASRSPARSGLYELWGENCGEPDSFSIRYRNDCTEPIAVKYCVQRAVGDWSGGLDDPVEVGEVSGAGSFVCTSTGDYWAHAIPAGTWWDDECELPECTED